MVPGGYDLPAGTTVLQMMTKWPACTDGGSRGNTNLVAQYRIAASYGLAQFVYSFHSDKLGYAAPETFYNPQLSIRLMADFVGSLRDTQNPALNASSTDIKQWNGVLSCYNGGCNSQSVYPSLVAAWYNGQGAASVQPIVAVVYDAEATALPALLASAASERRQAAAARTSGMQVVAQITADIVGDGKPRLITLEQATTRAGATTAVARVHKGTALDSPALYATPVITGVYGVGGLEVATPAGPGQPLLLVETPVGPHTLVTRIFTVRNGKLRELAPDVANSALPGFLTDRAPVQIGNDGTVFATVEGDPGHRVTTVYRPTSRGYARDRVVDLGPADTTFAISDNDRGADRSDQLRLVNRSTGATTLIGDTGAADIEGVIFKPGSDVLYATSGDRLGVLSLTTGAFNPLTATFGKGHGALGALTFRNVNTVAFEPATGKLYGVRHRPRAQEQDLLFQIDPTTGAVIPDAFGSGQDYIAIGGPGVPEDISAIAFDPTSGQLYGVSGDDGDGGVLVTIDKLTGSGRIVGPLGVADVEGLAFLDDGALYVSTGDKDAGSQGRIYRLDQSTGGTTLVSAFVGGRDYEAIAGRARTEMPIDG